MRKQEVILVGGGDSYSKREDFLQALRTQDMYDLPVDEPYKSWKGYLISALEETHIFYVPVMPNKQNAHYDEWQIWFERHLAVTKGDLILIGHSLGAMFLAKYLIENEINRKIKALFLMAGPCGSYEDGTGNDCADFQFEPADLKVLNDKVQSIVIMHSQDDFCVPYEHALKYKAELPEAELVTFEDKNHFLVEELPELVEKIREVGSI